MPPVAHIHGLLLLLLRNACYCIADSATHRSHMMLQSQIRHPRYTSRGPSQANRRRPLHGFDEDDGHTLRPHSMCHSERIGVRGVHHCQVGDGDAERRQQSPARDPGLGHTRKVQRQAPEMRRSLRRLLRQCDLVRQRLRIHVLVVVEEAGRLLLSHEYTLVLDSNTIIYVAHLVAHCRLVCCKAPLVVHNEFVLVCPWKQVETNHAVVAAAP
mmetsp:Transcript_8289/g.27375  ORF Transcript_8289/g.27375 Transcript_8289/m.27375 type:complete len:213 (-) Transcript_8289:313-951(-)